MKLSESKQSALYLSMEKRHGPSNMKNVTCLNVVVLFSVVHLIIQIIQKYISCTKMHLFPFLYFVGHIRKKKKAKRNFFVFFLQLSNVKWIKFAAGGCGLFDHNSRCPLAILCYLLMKGLNGGTLL